MRILSALLFAAALLGAAACGGNVVAEGQGGGTSAGAGGTGGAGGASGVDCAGSGAFPTFDKTCTADADCVTKLHEIDCCGTHVAIGVNQAESAAFDAAEQTCESQYPGCGCASQVTTAEDGKMATTFDQPIPVACTMGQCRTYIP